MNCGFGPVGGDLAGVRADVLVGVIYPWLYAIDRARMTQ
jgi:hypothetical protein